MGISFFAAMGLSVVAGWISLTMLRRRWRGEYLPGCGPRSGCEAVHASRWSGVGIFGGIPVELLGCGLYLLLAIACLCSRLQIGGNIATWLAVFASTCAGVAALWFIFLQVAVIRRICMICMLVQALGLAVWMLVGWEAFAAGSNWANVWTATAVGVIAVIILALAQVIFPAKTYITMPPSTSPTNQGGNPPPKTASLVSHPEPSHRSRQLTLGDGNVVLDRDAWPTLGSQNAERSFGFLFDVTCEACRQMYRQLDQVLRQTPTFASVILIPVPLHPDCNPAVPRPAPEAEFACEFTRLLLAVWRASPEHFKTFADWLMAARLAPPLQDARNRAQKLCSSNLSVALLSSMLGERITESSELYRRAPSEKLPQLLLPKNIVVGHVATSNELIALVKENA